MRATPGNGQIDLGSLSNNNDGVGFAAYNANSLSTPRYVALYTPVVGSGTLAVLQEKSQFGQGTGDHLTMGSPTANNTLVLLNSIDLNGGANRRFDSIRGVGIVPEGEYAGSIINSAAGQQPQHRFRRQRRLDFRQLCQLVRCRHVPDQRGRGLYRRL